MSLMMNRIPMRAKVDVGGVTGVAWKSLKRKREKNNKELWER
jgi:hypothetical protein